MNKGLPLAVFVQCLNVCYSLSSCRNCTAYDKNCKTCFYSNPHEMLAGLKNVANVSRIIGSYSIEHVKIQCTNCDIGKKHNEYESVCVFNQIKILCKLKHPTNFIFII